MNKKTVSTAAIFSVAATWFGIHAGGGFASGSQTMGFITRFGVHALWSPILVVTLMALAYQQLLILGKNHNVYDFRSLTNVLYHPYEKVLSPLYEVCTIVANIMAIASCVAGGATVLLNYFGLPYMIGIVAIGAVMLILSIFGRDMVLKAGTALSIIIFVAVLIICLVALTNGNGHLNQWMSAPEANSTNLGYVILKAFSYAGFQCWGPVAGILGISEILKTNKNINKALILGWIINVIMLWLTNYTMMCYMPDCTQSALPIFWICESTEQKFVLIAYVIALFAAYISTGVGVVFGLVKRYSPVIMKKSKVTNEVGINAVVGAVFIIATVLISTIGLTNIINYGFGYMGYVGIIMIFIPAMIVARIKNRKFAKEHPNFDEENLAK